MILPSTAGAALATALLSMACWGSWSNFLVFTGDRMRFEAFYMNYSVAVLISAIAAAFTLGMARTDTGIGARTVADDLNGVPLVKYAYAFLAGLVFNLANLALCKGIAMLGLALAFPLCIGTAMVLGTVLTYIISPSGTAVLLFSGVFVAFCAVCAAAVMHRLKEQQQNAIKTQRLDVTGRETGLNSPLDSVNEVGPSMTRKLSVCIIGGILMSLWNPLVALAEKDPHGLTPFGEFVLYTLAIFISSLVLVPLIIAYPLEGGQGNAVGEVMAKYVETPLVCHAYSFLGGMVWAIGTLANAMAGASNILNPAESYAIGQCANVAAIFWGVFLFNEFEGTDFRVKALIVLVLILYGSAIALVTVAG